MKNQTIKTNNTENKNGNIGQHSASRLSNNAFYLISLAFLLKKEINPTSLKKYLAIDKTGGLNGNLST